MRQLTQLTKIFFYTEDEEKRPPYDTSFLSACVCDIFLLIHDGNLSFVISWSVNERRACIWIQNKMGAQAVNHRNGIAARNRHASNLKQLSILGNPFPIVMHIDDVTHRWSSSSWQAISKTYNAPQYSRKDRADYLRCCEINSHFSHTS